ncbi:glycosyltransferase family 4 protein [Janibacter melonis]|nr:glycosyltransferase family 4 protein [Janibacter melonis]
MKVGFVSQWYPPELGTGVPRAIAQGLARLGNEVHVLTGFPNYPSGQLYPGYSISRYMCEQDEEVKVHRAPLYPDHSRSAVRRMANYVSFAVGASAVSLRNLPTPDVWLTYSSPATAAIPAMLPRRHRAPHAMIIQDLWPDSVIGSDMAGGRASQVMAGPLHAFSRATYRSADGIGVISPGMRQVLVSRGVDPAVIHDTPNWVDGGSGPRPSQAEDRTSLNLPTNGAIFLYAGNLGEMQELVPLIEAFDRVTGAHLVLMGGGASRDRVVEAAQGRTNVHVLPPVDAGVVRAYQHAADVLVVSLRDTPLLRVTMPSKVQSSMAAGRAIFVHGAGDVADVVRRAGCGAAAVPRSSEVAVSIQQLVDAGAQAREQMGARARDFYDANFSAAAGSRRVHDLLISTVERHGNR